MDAKHSRREFLQKATIATGGLFLGSHFPDVQALARGTGQTADKVRMGIIGVGSRGQYLYNLLKRIPEVDVIAVCDDYERNLKKAFQMSSEKAESFVESRDLLTMKEIDAVVIATPLYLHSRITIDS